jgi:hypothetical protein
MRPTLSANNARRKRLAGVFGFMALTVAALFVGSAAGQSADSVVHRTAMAEPPALVKSGVPITQDTYAAPRVIYSVPVGLDAPPNLAALGEVIVSRCNSADAQLGGGEPGGGAGDLGSPCESIAPYDYDPQASAKLIVADSPTATAGRELTPWTEVVCSRPLHHCPLALQADTTELPADRHLNLIVAANSQGAPVAPTDVVELEGDCEGGDYANCQPIVDPQRTTKGKLDLIRSMLPPPAAHRADTSLTSSIPVKNGIDKPPKVVVYQQRLDDVRTGEVIRVDAAMNSGKGDYDASRVLVGSRVAFVADPQNALPEQLPGAHDQFISAENGFNCRTVTGCRSVKVGAIKVTPGTPERMYVVYVAYAVSKGGPSGSIVVEPGGFLDVTRYPNGVATGPLAP